MAQSFLWCPGFGSYDNGGTVVVQWSCLLIILGGGLLSIKILHIEISFQTNKKTIYFCFNCVNFFLVINFKFDLTKYHQVRFIRLRQFLEEIFWSVNSRELM